MLELRSLGLQWHVVFDQSGLKALICMLAAIAQSELPFSHLDASLLTFTRHLHSFSPGDSGGL